MKFDRDPPKNAANIRRHGVDFEDARYVFDDPSRLEGLDIEHRDDEERWEVAGRPDLTRQIVLSVIFTPRGSDILRITSARKADPPDVQDYYAQFPGN